LSRRITLAIASLSTSMSAPRVRRPRETGRQRFCNTVIYTRWGKNGPSAGLTAGSG